jgi:hypothetical protein
LAALIPTTMLHVRFTPDGGHWTTVQVGVRLQFMHLRVALRSIIDEPSDKESQVPNLPSMTAVNVVNWVG